MSDSDLKVRLLDAHAAAVAAYRAGCREPHSVLPAETLGWLDGNGISARVIFDYAEDFVGSGEPTAEEFVEVARIRVDWSQNRPAGSSAGPVVPESALPLRSEELEGIPWLPRIYAKARCFLEGTLADEVMFGCGGDRAFVRRHGISLPGFLRAVHGGDRADALAYVRSVTVSSRAG
ncbi:MAG: hypothetical protein SFU53_00075 [Terrimicrobiaceae bacterium]|nr:hypothetical protein [Terrimicrobiaceae bacterium]